MKRVALIRPNDFIVGSMSALITRLGLEPVKPANVQALQTLALDDLIGAVVSTAVSSPMPLSFPDAAWALRQRSEVPMIATTMMRDAAASVAFVAGELKGKPGDFTVFSSGDANSARLLGSPKGLLVLRFEEIQAAAAPHAGAREAPLPSRVGRHSSSTNFRRRSSASSHCLLICSR